MLLCAIFVYLTSSENKHVIEILSKRRNLTYITNTDGFQAGIILLFTICFRLNGLKLEKRHVGVFEVNLSAIRFNLVQFSPSVLHCGFQ